MTDGPDLDALLDGVAAGGALLDAVGAPWLYEGCSLLTNHDADIRLEPINPYGPRETESLLYDRSNKRAWVQSTAKVDLADYQ